MKPFFVDNSGWYDLLFARAPQHREIVEVMRRPEATFVTSTYVLEELAALLLARAGHATAAQGVAHIRRAAEVRVEHPDASEELGAWALFLARPDKKCTLTDCLSFVIMRRLGIETAVATDDHFRQEGFTVVP